MIRSDDIARLFSALAHPSRVEIFLGLLPYAQDGLSMGDLGDALEIPPSTLVHHLREMERGGVIQRSREGRITRVTLDIGKLEGFSKTIEALCCSAQGSSKERANEKAKTD